MEYTREQKVQIQAHIHTLGLQYHLGVIVYKAGILGLSLARPELTCVDTLRPEVLPITWDLAYTLSQGDLQKVMVLGTDNYFSLKPP